MSERVFLEEKSKEIRRLIIRQIGTLGVGHIGGCLSIVEGLSVLYYKHLNADPKNPQMEGRDRVIMSKGHAGPTLYAILADRGYFPIEELDTLNKPETNLPSHCDMNRTKGIDMTTGSLGQGMSCAVGIAIGSKLKKDNAYIYGFIGDGESQEGQVWEAGMLASHMKLDNLIVFTDYNKLQIDGTLEQVNSLGNIHAKWDAFGWNVIDVKDGHDVVEIDNAITSAKANKGNPTMIILNTVKGKGVSFVVEKGAGNHNMPFSKEDMEKALKELD